MAEHADTPDRQLSESTSATPDGTVDETTVPNRRSRRETDAVRCRRRQTSPSDTDDPEGAAESDKPAATERPRSGVRLGFGSGDRGDPGAGRHWAVGWGTAATRSTRPSSSASSSCRSARQGALNLTTISYTEADADVQRILDSATGTFLRRFSEAVPAVRRSRQAGAVEVRGHDHRSGSGVRRR